MKKLSGYVEINAHEIIDFDDDEDIQIELQKVYAAYRARAFTDKLIGERLYHLPDADTSMLDEEAISIAIGWVRTHPDEFPDDDIINIRSVIRGVGIINAFEMTVEELLRC